MKFYVTTILIKIWTIFAKLMKQNKFFKNAIADSVPLCNETNRHKTVVSIPVLSKIETFTFFVYTIACTPLVFGRESKTFD